MQRTLTQEFSDLPAANPLYIRKQFEMMQQVTKSKTSSAGSSSASSGSGSAMGPPPPRKVSPTKTTPTKKARAAGLSRPSASVKERLEEE